MATAQKRSGSSIMAAFLAVWALCGLTWMAQRAFVSPSPQGLSTQSRLTAYRLLEASDTQLAASSGKEPSKEEQEYYESQDVGGDINPAFLWLGLIFFSVAGFIALVCGGPTANTGVANAGFS
eukprot:TRINITY_DN1323_c0_g2_i1.p1 TRINITY_DN1323_c0_g2~~TRINITY_DN1323_c0_g2_i1.p1  ORF type:complete len:123 (+),score=35.11 TRINITY_DN1323_c0_g2_i1:89-457(+)